MNDRLIRKPELEATIGLCERQIRRLEDDGLFPQRVRIVPAGRAVGWSLTEVNAWLAERLAEREKQHA